MLFRGMWAGFVLMLVFFACVDINAAKMIRSKRSSCVYNQHTNGCSTPFGNEPYRDTFTPACNEHDVCYFCGTRYGVTRSQCDVQFRDKAYELCDAQQKKRFFWSAIKNLFTGQTCKAAADVYYGAVDNFGASYYVSPSPAWCEETCVRNHLENYFTLVV